MPTLMQDFHLGLSVHPLYRLAMEAPEASMSRCIRVSTLVLGLILAGSAVAEGQSAAATELPTYEVMGFPITPHQVSLMGLPNVQERSPTPTLMSGGMPASPHQVTVLTPRPRMTEEAAARWTRVHSTN